MTCTARTQTLRRSLARFTSVGLAVALATGAASVASGTAHAAPLTTAKAGGDPALLFPAGVKTATTHSVLAAPKVGLRSMVVPASVDLSGYHVPVMNQGNHSSCVGWTVGYALVGLEARRAGLGDPGSAAYYVYSQINGGTDNGSWPVDALNVVATQGVDTVPHYWQQAADDVITRPDASEKANAAQWKVTGVHNWFGVAHTSVIGGDAGVTLIKTALASGHPVAISIPIRKGFDAMYNTGVSFDNDNTTASRGGHEVLAVGYDSNGLVIQNSWGTGFGSGGFARLAWNVVKTDVDSAFSIDGLARTTTTDTTVPTVSAPASLPQLGSSTATSGVTKYVTKFTASDAGGVSSTLVDYQTDGGTWVALTLPAATTTSFTFDLTPGHTYRFTASAYDKAGNWSGWVYGATFGVGSYSEASASYSTGWTQNAWTSAVGGALRVTSTANASASFTFTGRGVAWVTSKSTNRGVAYVYLDGVYQGTWDTYAATTQARAVALTATWPTSGTHTLRLVNAATSGRPNIDVDNFVVTT